MTLLKLEFNEKPISIKSSFDGIKYGNNRGDSIEKYAIFKEWKKLGYGESSGKYFNLIKCDPNKPSPTITGTISVIGAASVHHWNESRKFNPVELCRIQTFPDDYSFLDQAAGYICGMSVPPFMTHRISREIAMQLFEEKKVPPLKNGPWHIEDLDSIEKHGLKVFSCFCCGGGSSMGYKLSGFDVVGGVEIDKKISAIYKKNLKPKYLFEMGVQDFNSIPDKDLPEELFGIDILDGSPPCSSFSMAGSREKKWGKKTYFREGQEEQVLDDLFFHFINTADKLKPKVVVAENVKGILQGNAKYYVKQIVGRFREIGYHVQIFLLNAASMGVPQRRERVFFIAQRLDFFNEGKKVKMEFSEKGKGISTRGEGNPLTKNALEIYNKLKPGQGGGVANSFNCQKRIHKDIPTFSLCASGRHWHHSEPRYLSDLEVIEISSFPDNYSFLEQDAGYICGMSVPPFMMNRISSEIGKQLFNIGS